MTQAQMKKPIGRPKGEQAENAARRRKQLIEAAIDSIVERGLSATTLATVSKSAGLSQGVAVFYFKSKQNLLVETLRYHYEEYAECWKGALEKAGSDPLERLIALIMADLDDSLCTPRNLTLWNSFWGEAAARPQFAEICDTYDGERAAAVLRECKAVEGLITDETWAADSVADTLDAMTDGMWIRMHITPGHTSTSHGRNLLLRFMATVFPDKAPEILSRLEKE